uniref:phosphoinositide phospholipase C n=1 Tax=Odontella aurita TaxID=265563 RepID=A0A7S4IXS3_9STRA|mmetsp:Transcript_32196/g.96501  ORF Transcript_32196/g.96501 Transcript_32196/m.96501 type:complete len:1168 (+) Transcript_32196:3-3506(+)
MSPEDRLEEAQAESSRAKDEAAFQEKRAFNLQVKARRAEEHSRKLLKKLGWDVSEIEQRRAELEGDERDRLEEKRSRDSAIASVNASESSPLPLPRLDTSHIGDNPLERIRLTPCMSTATSHTEPATNKNGATESPFAFKDYDDDAAAGDDTLVFSSPAKQDRATEEDKEEEDKEEDAKQSPAKTGSSPKKSPRGKSANGETPLPSQDTQRSVDTDMDAQLDQLDKLVAVSGSSVLTDNDFSSKSYLGDTFEEDTFGLGENLPKVMKEGWLEAQDLWKGVDETEDDALEGAPTSFSAGSVLSSDTEDEPPAPSAERSPKPPVLRSTPPERPDSPIPEEEGLEIELLPVSEPEKNVPPPSPAKPVKSGEQGHGMEVQHFFAESVNQAKLRNAEADEAAMIAAKTTDKTARALRKASKGLSKAEEALYSAVQRERDLALHADRAASEARSNREHAEIAAQRVVTVRELLNKCEDRAASSETVAVTAVTEASISEERAADAEKRARRAQSNASHDRKKADEETAKEERLEKELRAMKRESADANNKANERHQKAEQIQEALDRVDEQLHILEGNEQYRSERRQAEAQRMEEATGGAGGGSGSGTGGGDSLSLALVRKHAQKTAERSDLVDKLAVSNSECGAAELNRKSLEEAYYRLRHRAQSQSKAASAARRQADQSTHVSEQLAEYAEEEREAANMRRDACVKAEACVTKAGSHQASMEQQVAEAERAAKEAEELAVSSRENAERLAERATKAKDISKEQEEVEQRREDKKRAENTLASATAVKEVADARAAEAKRHLDTAYEVFYQAKRVSVAEAHRHNAERRVERNAVDANDAAIELRRRAEEAKVQAENALLIAAEKVAAAKRARDYRDKKAMVADCSLALARITALHGVKFRYWEKSMAIPASHMHSISEGRMMQLSADGEIDGREDWIEFNKNHLTRVFPSRHARLRAAAPNFNPVPSWALGCQMVAVNFQACDDNLLLNDGRFRVNASSGYVLKPERLTDGRKARTVSRIASAIDPDLPCKLRVRVLSGYNIPAPENRMGRTGSISPRIRVALYDGSAEHGSKEATPQVHLTDKVRRNGLNPVWNERRGAGFYATVPDVAMLLITVWDSGDDGVARDDFIGAASMPVSCVREGYRSVPLFDAKHSRSGSHAFSSLLVKVDSRQ